MFPHKFPDNAQAKSYVADVKKRYQPARRFKKTADASFDTLRERAEATLLEYGEKVYGSVVYDEEKQDRKRERDEQRGGGKNKAAALTAEEVTRQAAGGSGEAGSVGVMMSQALSADEVPENRRTQRTTPMARSPGHSLTNTNNLPNNRSRNSRRLSGTRPSASRP